MKQSTKYWKIFCNLAYAVVLLLAAVLLLPRVLVFFMPFVVGFILSLIANPMVRFLENKIKMKRKYGTVLIIIAVIAVIVLLCYGAGAALVAGLKGFFDYLPTFSICQSIGETPIEFKIAFVFEKWRQPKKPLVAESGLG